MVCRIWSAYVLYSRLLINSQYVNSRHANKQLLNSETWSLKSVPKNVVSKGKTKRERKYILNILF